MQRRIEDFFQPGGQPPAAPQGAPADADAAVAAPEGAAAAVDAADAAVNAAAEEELDAPLGAPAPDEQAAPPAAPPPAEPHADWDAIAAMLVERFAGEGVPAAPAAPAVGAAPPDAAPPGAAQHVVDPQAFAAPVFPANADAARGLAALLAGVDVNLPVVHLPGDRFSPIFARQFIQERLHVLNDEGHLGQHYDLNAIQGGHIAPIILALCNLTRAPGVPPFVNLGQLVSHNARGRGGEGYVFRQDVLMEAGLNTREWAPRGQNGAYTLEGMQAANAALALAGLLPPYPRRISGRDARDRARGVWTVLRSAFDLRTEAAITQTFNLPILPEPARVPFLNDFFGALGEAGAPFNPNAERTVNLATILTAARDGAAAGAAHGPITHEQVEQAFNLNLFVFELNEQVLLELGLTPLDINEFVLHAVNLASHHQRV